jgi:hypothetical protein
MKKLSLLVFLISVPLIYAQEHSGGIAVPTPFKVTANAPIDDRFVVSDSTALHSLPNKYDGMFASTIDGDDRIFWIYNEVKNEWSRVGKPGELQDLQSVMENGGLATILDPLNPRLEEGWGYLIYGSDGAYQDHFYKSGNSGSFKNSAILVVDNTVNTGNITAERVAIVQSDSYTSEQNLQLQAVRDSNIQEVSLRQSITDLGASDFKLVNTNIDGTKTMSIESHTETGMVITDEVFERGLEYAEDYSANFTDRSLVDKEYVDSVSGGGDLQSVMENGAFADLPAIELDSTYQSFGYKFGTPLLDSSVLADYRQLIVSEDKFLNGIDYKGFYHLSDNDTFVSKEDFTNLYHYAGEQHISSNESISVGKDIVHNKSITINRAIGANLLEMELRIAEVDEEDTLTKTSFLISKNSTLFTDDFSGKGIQYATDYSDNYTNRSLVDKGYVDNAIPTKTSDLTNDSGFITSSSININIDPSPESVAQRNEYGQLKVTDGYSSDHAVNLGQVSGFLSTLSNSIPTKTSELENDNGFITSSSIPAPQSLDGVLGVSNTSERTIVLSDGDRKTITYSGESVIYDYAGDSITVEFEADNNYTHTLPNKNGTYAMVEDLPDLAPYATIAYVTNFKRPVERVSTGAILSVSQPETRFIYTGTATSTLRVPPLGSSSDGYTIVFYNPTDYAVTIQVYDPIDDEMVNLSTNSIGTSISIPAKSGGEFFYDGQNDIWYANLK